MAGTLETIHPRSIKALAGDLGYLIRSRLWAQILTGMALGIVFGLFFRLQRDASRATVLSCWRAGYRFRASFFS